MKYKNYRNSYTKEDRIYSKKNIADMSVREAFSRKNEIMAQYDSIGIPSEGELAGSPNAVWVDSYTREDGTEVSGYWRSKPEGSVSEAIDNTVKNYTKAEKEQGNVTGGASEIQDDINVTECNNSDNIIQENIIMETAEEKAKYYEQERQKSIARHDPDEVAGVKRGEPKTFLEMMQQGVNPNYNGLEDVDDIYSNNCACCAVTAELIMRGYDVEAAPNNSSLTDELSKVHITAYLDPITGNPCEPELLDTYDNDCYELLNNKVKEGERYELHYYAERELFYGENPEYKGQKTKTVGHVEIVTKTKDYGLVIYDPQTGEIHYSENDAKLYINSWINDQTLRIPRILRVDDKALNPKYVNIAARKR